MEGETKNIVFSNEICIAAFSRQETAKEHMHDMIQVFLFRQDSGMIWIAGERIEAKCIWIPSNVPHSFSGKSEYCLSMILDPVSELAHYIKTLDTYIELRDEKKLQEKLDVMLREQTVGSFQSFLYEFEKQINYKESKKPIYDHRVEEAIRIIRKEAVNNLTVTGLSYKIGISESRLTHLFKEQTGLTIKRYILLCKWRKAYLDMISNKNITISAMDGGFASSSHFSKTNTSFTGITAQDMNEHSILIKE